ncbi:DUF1553 domain-containing protein [Flavilitoribacter nigricans]|uniref:DUF1553 domain-containing protein n=1 Tax=Flavilitoribacter nigricans (strain ATCC 23147 / DSM 23189 / NBRC 102662 / NCIMB 1420 / SS-2) TaxID=1122177 RepID=A0A2D0N1W5_FLAN2|nr:DUF1553 domain-containing protein [Flavilitoribacter nigricans]PHN02378.1 hypothetical protein CRP01_32560 [Flavilitoribacter nigricans DSM 23189 = NBRC 102662]
MKSSFLISLFGLICGFCGLTGCTNVEDAFTDDVLAQLPDEIDFNFHVKPILSDKCFACHGPDENKLQAGLHLDRPDQAYAVLESGGRAIVPGKVKQSTLYHRILSADPELQMPPPEFKVELTAYEKAVLIRWIDQGAAYKTHWSFSPPTAPALPPVDRADWVRNPIDRFVLARLEKAGLEPARPADKTTLIRRLTFDLTGLPPTLKEIDAFLADDSDKAYEKLVDRLLASPHYGERMAMDWLDVARYADSHGFHADGFRRMWPWRDWVIKAFNENLSYDQFITWQLAGDLLPNATREQVLATGFNRNNPINSESGIVPEEYRVENVVDRTATMAKAFMGLTVECARCHDHKYDPVSQKEFYQLSAFFNNVDELGMVSNDGAASPTMPLLSDELDEVITFIRERIDAKSAELQQYQQRAIANPAEAMNHFDREDLLTDLTGYYSLDQPEANCCPNAAGRGPEARAGKGVERVAGKFGQALRFDDTFDWLSLPGQGDFERTDPFSISVWVRPELREDYASIIGNAGGKNSHWRGYELFLDSLNRPSVRLTHNPPDHRLEIYALDSIRVNEWSHLSFTYDGSSRAAGIKLYRNGEQLATRTRYDQLYKSIRTINDTLKVLPYPLRVGRSYQSDLDLGLFQGAVDEIRIYQRDLTAEEVFHLAHPDYKAPSLAERTPAEKKRLGLHQLQRRDTQYLHLRQELTALRNREHAAIDTFPEIMVMREMDPPRPTYVLDRGLYDAPTERVLPGTPAAVLTFSDTLERNRLGLARWLLSPEHPLTTRVLVNRYWHLFFGRGIVHTLEDLGNQGALPSHPELLDWLAIHFRQSNWDLKALVRTIVTSATYRQSSEVDPEIRQRDPANELLTRGPAFRLSAEMIRDNALLASGLLVAEIGGPSVKTYQPDDLWSKTHFSRLLVDYKADRGKDLYRRSLYTFIRRTAPPPTMTVLDAPDRAFCVVRRQKTSTPLQSLLLLNEPQMIEAARMLAERMLRQGGSALDEQLDFGFRLLTSRHLLPEEQQLMLDLYEEELQRFRADPAAAEALLQVGDHPRNIALVPAEVAAGTVVANIMMNYDEVYTKK